MEVINLKHKKITAYSFNPAFISIHTRVVTFSAAAVREFDMKIGMYVHFMNDGRHWSFIINDDPDGFQLVRNNSGDETNGVRISSAPLSHLMRKSLQIGSGCTKYYIQKTNRVFRDYPVYEILTAKSVDTIMGK